MKITKHGTRYPFWKGVLRCGERNLVFFSPDGEEALQLKADEWLLNNDDTARWKPILRIVKTNKLENK